MNPILKKFSKHLFWDTRLCDINMEKHCRDIIERVITRGELDDWWLILDYYTFDKILAEAMQIRCLEPTALAFMSRVGNVPKEKFRCYKHKLSNPSHWVF